MPQHQQQQQQQEDRSKTKKGVKQQQEEEEEKLLNHCRLTCSVVLYLLSSYRRYCTLSLLAHLPMSLCGCVRDATRSLTESDRHNTAWLLP
jgi:hypothetical protein